MVTTCNSLFLGEQNWAGVAGVRGGVPPVPQFRITVCRDLRITVWPAKEKMDTRTKVSPLLAEAADAAGAVAELVDDQDDVLNC